MLRWSAILLAFFILPSDGDRPRPGDDGVVLTVLGNVQDGGWPHPGCNNRCCRVTLDAGQTAGLVAAIGLVDFRNQKQFMVDASPDLSLQLRQLSLLSGKPDQNGADAIFLSHAHIGHYSGLMYLGREALATRDVPVYAMSRMRKFLETNGPWGQLVKLGNIRLHTMKEQEAVSLTPELNVTPLLVPHRDEYSETVGFVIRGPQKKVLYIPDIDKWSKWNKDIVEEVKRVDYALLDGTFFGAGEIGHRDLSEIPHPFVRETIQLFQSVAGKERNKIYFIHLNHSNPLLNPFSNENKEVEKAGMHVARMGMKFQL